MDFTDVKDKYYKRNHLLFSRDSSCLQELADVLSRQKHRTVVRWALECAEVPAGILRVHAPEDERPREALEACRAWAAGRIKMPRAKKTILAVHAMAREMKDPADAARCHGVGQACSVVHTAGHALGLPVYELTAIVREMGIQECGEMLEKKIRSYLSCLLEWEKKIESDGGPWAGFLSGR